MGAKWCWPNIWPLALGTQALILSRQPAIMRNSITTSTLNKLGTRSLSSVTSAATVELTPVVSFSLQDCHHESYLTLRANTLLFGSITALRHHPPGSPQASNSYRQLCRLKGVVLGETYAYATCSTRCLSFSTVYSHSTHSRIYLDTGIVVSFKVSGQKLGRVPYGVHRVCSTDPCRSTTNSPPRLT